MRISSLGKLYSYYKKINRHRIRETNVLAGSLTCEPCRCHSSRMKGIELFINLI